MFGLPEAGTVVFVLYMIVFFGSAIFASTRSNFFIGTISIAVGLLGLEFILHIPIWEAIKSNPMLLAVYIVLFVGIGGIVTRYWSFPNYIEENVENIKRSYGDWAHNNTRAGITPDFEEFLESDAYRYKARYNKNRLANWMLMWPFTVAWDLSHRPAIWLFNQVYAIMGHWFEEASKSTARSLFKK